MSADKTDIDCSVRIVDLYDIESMLLKIFLVKTLMVKFHINFIPREKLWKF